MPFLKIDASPNMKSRIDGHKLVNTVFDAAVSNGRIDKMKLRTWLNYADAHKTADGDSENGFVHVTFTIRPGRPRQELKEICEIIFNALCDFLKPDFSKKPLAISLETRELNEGLFFVNK